MSIFEKISHGPSTVSEDVIALGFANSTPVHISDRSHAVAPDFARAGNLFKLYWQNIPLVFPGEHSGTILFEHYADKFIEHFYHPDHEAKLARPACQQKIRFELLFWWDVYPNSVPKPGFGIVWNNWKSLFRVFKALGGRREKLDIQVLWKRVRYPPNFDGKLEVVGTNMVEEVLKVANAALSLQKKHIDRVPGYGYAPRFLTQNTVDILTQAQKDDMVFNLLADWAEDITSKMYKDDEVRMGFLKWSMMNTFGVPAEQSTRDNHVARFEDSGVATSFQAQGLDQLN